MRVGGFLTPLAHDAYLWEASPFTGGYRQMSTMRILKTALPVILLALSLWSRAFYGRRGTSLLQP